MQIVTSLLLLVVVGLISPVLSSPKICSRCSCYPPEQPVTIYCNCNKEFKRLTMSPGDMRGVPTVKKFTVSFCQSVEFFKNSFTEAHDLATLSVQQVENATFHMGVFSALNMLVIEDVRDLRLEKKAFMGVNEMRNIAIRRTHIEEIPEYALYDIANLLSVDLEDVVIDNVRSKAVKLQMDHGSSMAIDNCVVNNIEEDGLSLMPAREFHLKRSNLTTIARNGINIVSRGDVLLLENHIGANISEGAVNITALSINIRNNTIEHLPANFISSIHGPLSFKNNTLLQPNIDISGMISLFSANSTGNRMPCLCSQKVALSHLSVVKEMWSLLDQNFCIAPCEVSLRNYPEKCPKVMSGKEEEDDWTGRRLCVLQTTTAAPTMASTRRPGRALYSSTSQRPAGPTASRHSGAMQVSTCTFLVSMMLAVSFVR